MSSQRTFKETVGMASDEAVRVAFNADIITSGTLYDRVAQLAAKAGIKTPTIFVSSSRVANAGALPHLDKGRLILTQGILDVFGTSHEHIAPELEAVISHELGHLKQGFSHMITSRYLPVTLLPIAAVMAYRYFHHKAQDAQHQAEPENPYPQDAFTNHFRHGLVDLAKEMAVSAAGLFVGLKIAKHLSRESEFFCDHFGATHSSPDAMIGALETIHTKVTNDVLHQLDPRDPFCKITAKDGGWFNAYVAEHVNAHPTLSERVGRLEEMKLSGKPAVHAGRDATSSNVGDWLGDLFPGTRVQDRHHGDTVHHEHGMGHGFGDGGGD